tara:strand:- start:287 stop:640 length:354 start_codon:yes stop_codon:yes gene_type:complete
MKTKTKIAKEFNENLVGYRFPEVKEEPVGKHEFTETQKLFVTGQAFDYLNALDKTFIGTNSYMGFAYFWGQEYKHTLRSANNTQRQRVHNAMVKAGLELTEASPEHEAIVRKYCKNI